MTLKELLNKVDYYLKYPSLKYPICNENIPKIPIKFKNILVKKAVEYYINKKEG